MAAAIISSISGRLDGFVHFALSIALSLGFALVIVLFTTCKSELDLTSSVFIKINRQRYQGQTLLRFDNAVQFVYLFFMHQKSADPERIDIVAVSLLVRSYVHAGQHEFAFARDLGITLLDAAGALTDRLDLGSGQYYARLKTVLDDVIVERFLIIRDYFA